ncbi:MAG: FAD-dependent monooxygenase [Polyangiaceae bacterium]|nr:FAD-dependent monooxygenase [Polyangiaceae bacterium]
MTKRARFSQRRGRRSSTPKGNPGKEPIEIQFGLDDSEAPEQVTKRLAQKLGVRESDLPKYRLLKRSLDARRGKVRFRCLYSLDEEVVVDDEDLQLREPSFSERDRGSIAIVGDGPAGLFCAWELARRGIRSTVIERGQPVQPRRKDLKLLNARGGVNAESNYCFGEGGAGTYSDGKLYTRSHKRGPVFDVLRALARHGAPPAILTDARPHIGSNLLPKIIDSMRRELEEFGTEFRFGTKVTGLLTEGQGQERRLAGLSLCDVETEESREEAFQAAVLATGHSARDVYQFCHRAGVALEAKPFALGVRIEHPQELINQIQFGRFAEHPKLGAASYKVVRQVEERGVFSFCMCPGGWIVPAMTDQDHLVVNGMSLSKRNSQWANSGFVVGVELQDLDAAIPGGDALRGIELQARAERAACLAGGGENRAPATRVSDFLQGKVSSSLPETSYLPGLTSASLAEVVDSTGLGISRRLRLALSELGQRMKGFDSEEAILVGVESRTSSPVRMIRDPESLQSPGLAGLYPAGEGAGFAGGIVSAAVDGMRIAERLVDNI